MKFAELSTLNEFWRMTKNDQCYSTFIQYSLLAGISMVYIVNKI